MNRQVALIAFGSNLGDGKQIYQDTVAQLGKIPGVATPTASQLIQTRPIGGQPDAPAYLNGALTALVSLEPLEMVDLLLDLEQQFGRKRDIRWDSRTIDLDLIVMGEHIVNHPRLTLPHPRMSFRRFVLEPACEIAGELIDPISGLTISALLQCLNQSQNRVSLVMDRVTKKNFEAKKSFQQLKKDWPKWDFKVIDSLQQPIEPPEVKLQVVVLPDQRDEKPDADQAAMLKQAVRFPGPMLKLSESDPRLEQEIQAAIAAMED